MGKNNVKEFENRRWRKSDQSLVFRHVQALKMVKTGQKVLDIACGDGLLLRALAQKGAMVSGIDFSEEGVRKCREKGLDVSVVDVATGPIPFQDDMFDVVTMLDVLEHFYVPEELLKEAIRVSKKYVIISVPNFNSLPARLQVLFGKVPENNSPKKGHVYWFTYGNLMKMFKQYDLRVVEMKTNTFFERVFLLGYLTKFFVKMLPSLFALSFVIKLEK